MSIIYEAKTLLQPKNSKSSITKIHYPTTLSNYLKISW